MPHVINSLPGNVYTSEVACGEIGLDIFLLPPFLFYPDRHLSWTRLKREDTLLVTLLISMTHRWYPAFGENPQHTDILVGASLRSPEKPDIVGLRYSETTMVGVQVTDMNKHLSSSGLDISLCSH